MEYIKRLREKQLKFRELARPGPGYGRNEYYSGIVEGLEMAENIYREVKKNE